MISETANVKCSSAQFEKLYNFTHVAKLAGRLIVETKNIPIFIKNGTQKGKHIEKTPSF